MTLLISEVNIMAKKRFNIILASLLSALVFFWLFYLLTSLGLITTEFNYHITMTLSFSILGAIGFLFMVLLCITSKDCVKKHPLMLSVFLADALRVVVYMLSGEWFDRSTDAGYIAHKIVLIGAFIIWLACMVNFIYRIFRNNIGQKNETQVAI